MFNEDTLKFLLMDLNLNINDSIIYNYYRRFPHDTIYVHVSKIDTIANLKIIEFDSPINYLSDDLSLKYIEGIGSNFGLVYPIEFSQILCKLYHEDELVYSFDTINLTCPIFTNIETYELSEDINIYPNPVESVLHISLKKGTPFPCPIYFYDLYGRELFHQNLTESETILYLPHLNTQMIFYKLMFEEYTVNGKILKQ